MTAKKTAPKADILSSLEAEMQEVEIKEEMVRRVRAAHEAEVVVLETMRARVWKLLGTPFGSVRLGMFNFSRLMLLIGVAFAGMMVGSIFVGPVLGLMIVGCVAAAGFLWIRAKL